MTVCAQQLALGGLFFQESNFSIGKIPEIHGKGFGGRVDVVKAQSRQVLVVPTTRTTAAHHLDRFYLSAKCSFLLFCVGLMFVVGLSSFADIATESSLFPGEFLVANHA
jgi:hypothetical protein